MNPFEIEASMNKQELLLRYEIDSKWRDAWNSLMNNSALMRKKYPLQTQLEKIERRAEIANKRIGKLIPIFLAYMNNEIKNDQIDYFSEQVPFDSIALNGKPIFEAELAYSCYSEVYRMYVSKDENGGFMAVGLYNPFSDNTPDCWTSNLGASFKVEVLFIASACFDGVRSLNFNQSISHPSLERLTQMLTKLRMIEVEICTDSDDPFPNSINQ
ncbi:hypothetical protein P7410_28185 [Vibrio parahaemolyticus]|nr:hypothetical protein [Vibrio parahaemolyticus]